MLDFTVIIDEPTHFGDQPEIYSLIDAHFVGREKTFTFNCPQVNASEKAVLQFMCFGLKPKATLFAINDSFLADSFTHKNSVYPDTSYFGDSDFGKGLQMLRPVWNHLTVVIKADTLKAKNNSLKILSTESALDLSAFADTDQKFNDFIIENAILFYKLNLAK